MNRPPEFGERSRETEETAAEIRKSILMDKNRAFTERDALFILENREQFTRDELIRFGEIIQALIVECDPVYRTKWEGLLKKFWALSAGSSSPARRS